MGKSGYMFILDRVTGKPVFGVEERPVDKSNVPGEVSFLRRSRFPLKPPPISRVSFTKDDIVTAADTTPEHAKACQELWDKFGGLHNAGPVHAVSRFTPTATMPNPRSFFRDHRRRELGRHRHRSEARLHLRQYE